MQKKKTIPMTNYQRYNYWKAAFSQLWRAKQVVSVSTIRITLQYPITDCGWARAEDLIRTENPSAFTVLLALTPYEPNDAQAS